MQCGILDEIFYELKKKDNTYMVASPSIGLDLHLHGKNSER